MLVDVRVDLADAVLVTLTVLVNELTPANDANIKASEKNHKRGALIIKNELPTYFVTC